MQRETFLDILNTKKPRVDGTPTTVSTSTIVMSPANKPEPKSSLIPVIGIANMQANIKNTIPYLQAIHIRYDYHCLTVYFYVKNGLP